MLGYARTLAETEKQASDIASSSVSTASPPEVNTVTQSGSLPNTGQKEPSQQPADVTTKKRFRCGLSWPHKDQPCPAEGQQCNKCKKYSHFARVCRSTRRKHPNNEIRNVKQDNPQFQSDDSDEYVYTLQNTTDKNNFHQTLKVESTEIDFQIDTGSTSNIINETSYKKFVIKNPEEVEQLSRDIFRPMILRYFLSASRRPVD